MSESITRGSAETVRQGFGETSIERRGETTSTALAAQAQAEIQARYVMAMQRRRTPDTVRTDLLRECSRPGFAQRAIFSVPRGDKPGRLTNTPNRIEGLSVRFAEAAIRVSGNILQMTRTIYDDDFKRQINVSVTDLETNAVYSRDVIIDKTVERSKPKDKAVILGSRTNSAGNVVYIVQATDDELLQKESSLISKTFRTLALRLVPADVLEECEQRIVATREDEDKKDPDAARKRLVDAFASLGVSPDELRAYMGHEIAQTTPAERLDLGGLYAAIRDGEVTWAEAVGERAASKEPAAEGAKATALATATVAERVAARQAAKKAAQAQAEQKTDERPAGRVPGQDDDHA
jgi:hypothetical protein